MTGSVAGPRPCPPTSQGLTHQGLLYDSDEAFLSAMTPFCLDGLESEDAVLAVTTEANIGLLRQALGDAAAEVRFADAGDWYNTPGATLGAYFRYVEQHTDGGRHRRVRVIGEPVWHGRDPLETAEWTRYESAINAAFVDCPAWIVCPYDTRILPECVVRDARRTHPELMAGRAARASDLFAAPDSDHGPGRRGLAPRPADGTPFVLPFGADLAGVRTFVTRIAGTLGMSGGLTRRLVFAVNEVATNVVQHAGGQGRVVLWRSGDRVVCDITDPGGPTSLEWYVGYLPPDPQQRRGQGLWAVRQLCDLMEVDTSMGETTVRLHLSLT